MLVVERSTFYILKYSCMNPSSNVHCILIVKRLLIYYYKLFQASNKFKKSFHIINSGHHHDPEGLIVEKWKFWIKSNRKIEPLFFNHKPEDNIQKDNLWDHYMERWLSFLQLMHYVSYGLKTIDCTYEESINR